MGTNRDLLHRLLSRRSRILDGVGRAGHRFFLYRENSYFHPELNGEHALVRRLKALGFEANIVLDIGANEGRWTAFASGIWPAAKFHLFEPGASIAERLRRRFAGNDRVEVHAWAVGDTDGSAAFHEDPQQSSHSFISQDLSSGTAVPLVSSATVFDRLNIAHADFCKIDTEGFDLAILEGLKPLLEAKRISLIQFEYHAFGGEYGRSFASSAQALRDLGYRVGKIFPEGLREVRYGQHSWGDLAGPNFLAASPDQHEIFERLLTR